MYEALSFIPSTIQEHLRGFNPQISRAMLSLPKGGGGWMQISEWWLLEGLRLLLGVLHQVAKSLTEVPPTGFQLHWKWEMRNRAPGKDLCAHGEERTTESRGKGDKWTASCIHPSLHYKGFRPSVGMVHWIPGVYLPCLSRDLLGCLWLNSCSEHPGGCAHSPTSRHLGDSGEATWCLNSELYCPCHCAWYPLDVDRTAGSSWTTPTPHKPTGLAQACCGPAAVKHCSDGSWRSSMAKTWAFHLSLLKTPERFSPALYFEF
jgi:hypothetical protein